MMTLHRRVAGGVCVLIGAYTCLGLHCPASSSPPQESPAARLDRAGLGREVDALLKAQDEGITAGLWLGGAGPAAWYERQSDQAFPTASAIKAFHLVEFFAAHKEALDKPLVVADRYLDDDRHPAFRHFQTAEREEIRKGLRGATVRRIARMMIRAEGVTNLVYNAAANLVTADLGGPEALTKLIHQRDPAFGTVHVRRYMLADRKERGDNEAPPAALAALHRRLATRTLAGIDAATMDALYDTLLEKRIGPGAARYAKDGALDSDPLTRVQAGWWETPKGPLVYVVMVAQPAPGSQGRTASGTRLAKTAVDLQLALWKGGLDALK